MALMYTVVASLAALLFSNLWLLKEIERLRRRLDACEREADLLNARIARIDMDLVQLTSERDEPQR